MSTGDAVPFQIQVANTGGVPVVGLLLRSRLSDGFEHPQGNFVEAEIASLPPARIGRRDAHGHGDSRRRSNVRLKRHGFGRRRGRLALASVSVLEPSLQLRRSGPTRCYSKSEIGFDLEATNPGSASANNLVVTDTLPAGFEFVMASEGGSY